MSHPGTQLLKLSGKGVMEHTEFLLPGRIEHGVLLNTSCKIHISPCFGVNIISVFLTRKQKLREVK